MKLPIFTDEQLEHYADDPRRDMTSLESQLAQTLLNDRLLCRRVLKHAQRVTLENSTLWFEIRDTLAVLEPK